MNRTNRLSGYLAIEKYKFHVLIFLFSFLILTRFNFDPDLGWHIAYGERFLNKGEIVFADPFSWTMAGYEWASSYFLYQILVVLMLTSIGYFTTAIIFGLIAALSIVLILGKKVNVLSVFLAAVGAGLASGSIAVRPHVFDMLLYSILLALLERKYYLKKTAPAFFLLFFAFWANFHLGFLLGIITLCGFTFLEVLRASNLKKAVIKAGLMLVFALVGGLITPFGYKTWLVIFLELGGPSAWLHIMEFLPLPFFSGVSSIYILSGLIFIWVCLKAKRKEEITLLFFGAFLFVMPVLSGYFALFWGIGFVFITTRYFVFSFKPSGILQQMVLALSIGASVMAIFLNFIIRTFSAVNFNNVLVSEDYPVEAVTYLKREKLTEGLFNEYDWGGYIIWQAPGIKVFIDGRMAGWKKDNRPILADYLAIKNGDCGVSEKYEISTLIVEKGTNVACFGDYERIYSDEVAEVWTKGRE